MSATIVYVVLAVALHYTLEYFGNLNQIGCPPYCEVDHKHIINKENQDDWNNGHNDVERQEEEYLHRTKRDDKHSSSE